MALLFENARVELDAIDELVHEDKKKVVKDLAKHLEGMIRTDSICIEIVNQLRGRVSERFIRESLEDKYKHPQRMQNARKQKKKRLQEREHNESLAALAPLNQKEGQEEEEEEETQSKEIVITQDVHGRSIEEDKQGKSYNYNNSVEDDNSIADNKAISNQQGLKAQSYNGLNACPSCKELSVENSVLKEALSRNATLFPANQFQTSEIKFTIPKEKYPSLQDAMQRSRDSISVAFDKSGILERAIPDILMERN